MPPKVSLAAIRAAEGSGGRRRFCYYAKFVAALDPQEKKELTEALADVSIGVKAIWRVLKVRGFTQGFWTVMKHRDGDCHLCGVGAAGKTRTR